jgi:hypothetical protein
MANHATFKHQMFNNVKLPSGKISQDVRHLSGREVRQKTQFSQINGNNGQLPASHLMGGTEDRPVATQDDGQIGILVGHIDGTGKVLGDDARVLLDKRAKPFSFRQHIGTLTRAHQERPERGN